MSRLFHVKRFASWPRSASTVALQVTLFHVKHQVVQVARVATVRYLSRETTLGSAMQALVEFG